MWKPWVVSAFYWAYVSGLVLLVPATFAFKRWVRPRLTASPKFVGLVWAVLGIGLVILFAHPAIIIPTKWIFTVGCFAAIGVMRGPIKTAITIVLISPVPLVLIFQHMEGLRILSSELPVHETQLNETYVCRVYLTPADSLNKTRVTVQRRSAWGFRDDLVRSIDGYERCFACAMRDDGQVEMAVHECNKPVTDEQGVVLELPGN